MYANAATLTRSATTDTARFTLGLLTESAANTESFTNIGTIWQNMHQMDSVNARFWIQPPLFQASAAMVGASKRAMPQYQECVGRQL